MSDEFLMFSMFFVFQLNLSIADGYMTAQTEEVCKNSVRTSAVAISSTTKKDQPTIGWNAPSPLAMHS